MIMTLKPQNMKRSLFVVLPILLSFVACHTAETDKTREFIPGKYVGAFEHEFGKTNDTLEIRHLNGNAYEIIKEFRGYSYSERTTTAPKTKARNVVRYI